MVYYVTGDLLVSGCDALVNTVNCVGVMGKGVALQFKKKYSLNFALYKAACRDGSLKPGGLFTTQVDGYPTIINFATKDHWVSPSKIEWIWDGLRQLSFYLSLHTEIRSVAIPPLGCGNGGLNWLEVKPVIEQNLQWLPTFCYVFENRGL